MKKLSVAFTIVLALAMILPLTVSAALPGTGWSTSFQVMNIGANADTFNMTAYDMNSTSEYASVDFPFLQYEALSYVPGVPAGGANVGFSTPLPSGFTGSVVVSAGVPVASVVTLMNNGVTGGVARARYQAIAASKLAKEILFPAVKHNYYGNTTTFYVQAAGAAADVTITYTMGDGSVHTQTTSIGANKTFIFDPANATLPIPTDPTTCNTSSATSPCFGAAKAISSTGDIAGVYVETKHTGSPAVFASSTRGLTATDQSVSIFAPSVKKAYFDSNAGFAVMNTGGATALARYQIVVNAVQPGSPAAVAGVVAGQTYSGEVIIPAGKTQVIGPADTDMGGLLAGSWGAMSVNSVTEGAYTAQPLVGISSENQATTTVSGGIIRSTTFGFVPSIATSNTACAIVKELTGGQTAGVATVNVGDQPAKLYFEYILYGTGQKFTFWTKSLIQPGAAIGTNRVSVNGATNFENDGTWAFSDLANKTFSVHVYSDPAVKIISHSQEQSLTNDNDLRKYECVNFVP